jgi:pyruvate formate lyase activating enzyme
MKGCPLRCKWCSNPESLKPCPEIMANDVKCILCGKCEEVCSAGAISCRDEARKIDWTKCDRCLECAQVCPSRAIEQSGTYMSVDEVFEQVERDRVFYRNSGGGVTASGGEALLQWEFVGELFRLCRERGIHTTLDTSGVAGFASIEKVLEHCDLVMFDIKHMDAKKHEESTGVGNQAILENAEKIASRVRTWLRMPLIPGYNDSETNIREFAGFAARIGVEKVSVLAYHEWGSSKYPKLGRVYPMEGTIPPDQDCLNRVTKMIESIGLKVEIGR